MTAKGVAEVAVTGGGEANASGIVWADSPHQSSRRTGRLA
jgi:hypothetical protein